MFTCKYLQIEGDAPTNIWLIAHRNCRWWHEHKKNSHAALLLIPLFVKNCCCLVCLGCLYFILKVFVAYSALCRGRYRRVRLLYISFLLIQTWHGLSCYHAQHSISCRCCRRRPLTFQCKGLFLCSHIHLLDLYQTETWQPLWSVVDVKAHTDLHTEDHQEF